MERQSLKITVQWRPMPGPSIPLPLPPLPIPSESGFIFRPILMGPGFVVQFLNFAGDWGSTYGLANMSLRDQWQFVACDRSRDCCRGHIRPIDCIRGCNAGTSGKFFYIDGAQCEAKAYPTPYCDGSLGTGHAWTGTAHASTSTRTAETLSTLRTCPAEFTMRSR